VKKILVLAVVAAVSYAGWQRHQRSRDVTADVQWPAEQVGQQVAESYVLFGASPVDAQFMGVEGPGGVSLMAMTSRMAYHVWKTNPDFIINCRTPGVRDIVSSFVGLMLVSDNPKGRRELASVAASFDTRAKGGGKRLCLKLEGHEITGHPAFGGNIPARLVRVSRFDTMDCSEMIAGM
jgi:hypothetical protein